MSPKNLTRHPIFYISGAMTYDKNHAPKFNAIKKKLSRMFRGIKFYTPLDIAKITKQKYNNPGYADFLFEDLRFIKENVDVVLRLVEPIESPGADAEISFARALGKIIILISLP